MEERTAMKTSPVSDADATNYDPGYTAIGYPRWGNDSDADGGDS